MCVVCAPECARVWYAHLDCTRKCLVCVCVCVCACACACACARASARYACLVVRGRLHEVATPSQLYKGASVYLKSMVWQPDLAAMN